MSAIDIELLVVTLATVWIGSKQRSWSALLFWSIGIAVIAWLVRCYFIAMFPTDVAVSEDYFNGMTVWNAATEIAIFSLWMLSWSSIGLFVARRRQGATVSLEANLSP